MKCCRYCDSELVRNYTYYNDSLTCEMCDVHYLVNLSAKEFSVVKRRVIDENSYSVIYLSWKDETYLYQNNNMVCILDGEVNPFDVFKRIKTVKVFS